nr:glycerol kinase GlpK [Gracilibacillus sp. YIM 98692]
MNAEKIIAIDQSTSGTKVLLVHKNGKILKTLSQEHRQIYPHSGWVEHDPNEIYENVKSLLKKIVAELENGKQELAGISITNQRETVVVWDKYTGEPLYNAIVWQCRRTASMCEQLKKKGFEGVIREKTGLTIDPYFSATKIKWILENETQGINEKMKEDRILIGTMDSWLMWKLTNGHIHATDYTNASRTLLFNINNLDWDSELLEIFGLDRNMLPNVRASDEFFGNISDIQELERLPLSGVIGDSQGALFGQKCFEKGEVKATFGTGTSLMMHAGEKKPENVSGLVNTIAWKLRGQSVCYGVEGIIHSTGDTLNWIRNNLQLFHNFSECDAILNEISDNEGVYLVPAFVGLGIPYWDPNARAAIFGVTRSTKKAHIIRAGLESIAYQVKSASKVIEDKSSVALSELKVDGGAIQNKFLMQFQADILNCKVVVPQIKELSAMGSFYLAGLAFGFWHSLDEIKSIHNNEQVYAPKMNIETRDTLYQKWEKYVKKVLTTAEV